jgi:uncharacterized protein YndB with AHSA1/START domain
MNANNLVVERDQLAFSMSRVFSAPPERLWQALVDPELIPSWWGPRYLTTTVDKLDLKVGGVWRFVQTDPDGNVHAFNGVFKVIESPERLSYTFEYEPMAGHISTDTIILEGLPGGKTRLIARTTFTSLDDLEGMLQSGMEGGAVETWDRLEELMVRV